MNQFYVSIKNDWEGNEFGQKVGGHEKINYGFVATNWFKAIKVLIVNSWWQILVIQPNIWSLQVKIKDHNDWPKNINKVRKVYAIGAIP